LTFSSSQRSGSVHGGAGGTGVRISAASSSADRLSSMGGGFGAGGGFGFSMDSGAGDGGALSAANEKLTMQNLNSRLSQYLERVRTLEEANAKLELKIRDWGLSHSTIITRDMSSYQAAIDDLRVKILAASTLVAELALQVDNTKLAADDFRIKFENELSLRQSVDADMAGLRKILDDTTLLKTDLEMQLESLKEELVYMKKNHEEETLSLRSVMGGQVQVEVDAAPAADLNHVISEIREQYEGLVAKNQRDAEAWFNTKAETVQQEVTSSTEVIQTSSVELKSSQNTVRDLELELQSLYSAKASLEGSLGETEARFGALLMGQQASATSLENQLTQIRADAERTGQEYRALLDIKTRLELEIAEYRRLLEGGDLGYTTSEMQHVDLKETSGGTISEVASRSSSSTTVVDSSSSSSTVISKVVTVVEETVVDGGLVSSSISTESTEEVVEA